MTKKSLLSLSLSLSLSHTVSLSLSTQIEMGIEIEKSIMRGKQLFLLALLILFSLSLGSEGTEVHSAPQDELHENGEIPFNWDQLDQGRFSISEEGIFLKNI